VCAAMPAALALISGSGVVGAQVRQQGAVHIRPTSPITVRHRDNALATLRSRWPVRGPINSDFGARRSWWRHRVHTGIDIGAARGTSVRAPAPGTVAFAGWWSGYGRTIIIDHGNRVHTLYGHLSKLGVRRGQLIAQGTTIGSTGSTGHASGPHLHYEILVRGRPVNPRRYLTDTPGTRVASQRYEANGASARRRGHHANADGNDAIADSSELLRRRM
jgi:murein DD-endopeptidase MepM/ murein hydrolase activator NlpD